MALFHIGYHKTASSFIQRFLFEAHPDVFHRVPQRSIYKALIYPGALVFDQQQGRKFVQNEIKSALASNHVPVFSNERLSGSFNTGGHDTLELMQRIRTCDDEAHILLVIREQRSMIRSLYSQYVRAYGCCSLEEFLSGDYTPHNKELFNPSLLDYHRLIEAYQNCFGPDRVTVLPYEWLRHDQDRFLQAVLDASGVSRKTRQNLRFRKSERINAASTPLQISVKRRLNPLYSSNCPHVGSTFQFRPTRWLAKAAISAAGKVSMKALNRRIAARRDHQIEQLANGRYQLSNEITSKLIGMNLTDLGYL